MVPLTVLVLCFVGLFASARMARKAWRDTHGGLAEASVVQAPAARLVLDIPNAYLGLGFYPLVALAYPFATSALSVRIALSLAVALAGLASLLLSYDLIAVTRANCPLCWAAHGCNAALVVATAVLWTP